MLIPNLKLDLSGQDFDIYIDSRTTLYILAPFTNDGFPFHAIMLGYLIYTMPYAWCLPVWRSRTSSGPERRRLAVHVKG